MANIGDKLTKPEENMKRIDGSDGNFIIDSTFNLLSNSSYTYFYKNNYYSSGKDGTIAGTKGEKIIFYVYTSKLYILAGVAKGWTNDIIMNIDNEFYCNCSEYNNSNNTFIIIGLKVFNKMSYHKIELINNTNTQMNFDCIDIDKDGILLSEDDYNLMKSYEIDPPQIGDRLPCPLNGYKRIDDSNNVIIYNGSFVIGESSDVDHFDNTSSYIPENTSSTNIENSYIKIIVKTKKN